MCNSLDDNYQGKCNQNENVRHIFMLNNSSLQLFDDLHKKTIFPSSGIYHSQQCHRSCLLWPKIFTLVNTGAADNPRDRKGASNTREERQVPSTCQLNRLHR